MNTTLRLVFFGLFVFGLSPHHYDPPGVERGTKPARLRIVGTVVGYDGSSHLLIHPESISYDILLIRVDKVLAGSERAKYIRLQYVYGPGEPALPEELFKGGSWCFKISRDPDYDLPLQELLYTEAQAEAGKPLPPDIRLRRVQGMENEQLPLPDTVIPAYAMKPGDYKKSVLLPNHCKPHDRRRRARVSPSKNEGGEGIVVATLRVLIASTEIRSV